MTTTWKFCLYILFCTHIDEESPVILYSCTATILCGALCTCITWAASPVYRIFLFKTGCSFPHTELFPWVSLVDLNGYRSRRAPQTHITINGEKYSHNTQLITTYTRWLTMCGELSISPVSLGSLSGYSRRSGCTLAPRARAYPCPLCWASTSV